MDGMHKERFLLNYLWHEPSGTILETPNMAIKQKQAQRQTMSCDLRGRIPPV